jgi:hypothetical protein
MTQFVYFVDEALRLCLERKQVYPTVGLFDSIEKQLAYLKAVLSSEETDRSRLSQIIVGVYAVREFDDSDPEFAKALKKAHYIADRMARGLKPDMQDLL